MENLLHTMRSDMLRLIELSSEISKYCEMQLHHNDTLDKRNYNAEKVEKIRIKIAELQKEFYHLKGKWF